LIKTSEAALADFKKLTGISRDSFQGYLEEEHTFLLTIKSTPVTEAAEMDYFKALVKLWECK